MGEWLRNDEKSLIFTQKSLVALFQPQSRVKIPASHRDKVLIALVILCLSDDRMIVFAVFTHESLPGCLSAFVVYIN